MNKAADALSRRHSLVATLHVSVPGLECLSDLYASDTFFAPIWNDLSQGVVNEYSLIDNFLFFATIGYVFCLVVSDYKSLPSSTTRDMSVGTEL